MRALIHDLLLSFESDDEQVLQGWRKLLDLEIEAARTLPEDVAAHMRVRATVPAQLPQPPAAEADYGTQSTENQQRLLRYYETPSGGVLDLARPARISFDFSDPRAHLYLTRQVLDAGNLEDITMIALAPLLRRRGFYMAHACAAARQTAVLLCGPSGSGKTTTGLALVQAGWTYLANDVTLLRHDTHSVNAYPSPGAINLHPRTLAMLPTFRELRHFPDSPQAGAKYIVPRKSLLSQEQCGSATAVSTILFPAIARQNKPTLHQVSPAIGVARLIEEGVDQWDRATYEEHLNLLTHLGRQASFFDLLLPRDSVSGMRQTAALLGRLGSG